MGTLKHDRMGIYVRESDVLLLDSETIESAINACREYGEKKGYTLNPKHIWKEARSGYKGSYVDQEALLDALDAAKNGEIDVFVITEIRSISRRGSGEVFVIYDMLQKANVRLETITETFENSAIGRFILSTRAFVAEVERENIYMRTMRGRLDRVRNGNLPGAGRPGYALKWVEST
jgi:DNA invertase Pin-like site-specific DNA recombinase